MANLAGGVSLLVTPSLHAPPMCILPTKHNVHHLISNQRLFFSNVYNYAVTFKLPLQEQGVSMLQSKSSSWQILHCTIFKSPLRSFSSVFSSRILHSSSTGALPCNIRFLLWMASSIVASVINRSTRSTKWSPMMDI